VYREDARFGLAFAAFSLLALVVLNRAWRLGTAPLQASREHSAGFYGYLGEAIGAAEDIRSSGATAFAMRRFFERLRAWLPVQRRAEVRGNAVWLAAIALFGLGDAIAYGLGGGLYRLGVVSIGTVYMFVAYAAMLAEPIEMIREQLQQLQGAHAGIARINELLATRSRLADGDRPLPAGALAVEFDGVSFGYDEPRTEDGGLRTELTRSSVLSPPSSVLSNISFTLAPGRVLGLLGHTGSGKSTIARLLFRLYDPQAGSVRLGGVDLRRARIADLRARVGLVTQEVQLFEATLRENITFFDERIADERVRAAVEMLGLGEWLARLPHGLDTPISAARLSAGEAQLIAFARVCLKDPGLVILDEAYARIDPATEALLQGAVGRLLAGRTAIVIAHRLATVERADELLIMERGWLVERGGRAMLATDPESHYARLLRAGTPEVLV
jgi:ATP-binding cassette subfamily B protein